MASSECQRSKDKLKVFKSYKYGVYDVMYICCREDRSEELRKVHESKMVYLNKTQTDKV